MTKQIVNKYPARPGCATCGRPVPAGAGFAQKETPTSEWVTRCRTCVTGEPAPEVEPAPQAQAPRTSAPAVDPTAEQVEALTMFGSAGFPSFVIEAGAGCGKTATARLLAESTDRPGAFMAFNKAIVLDAKDSMPPNFACKTIHGWAMAAEGQRFAHRLRSHRMTSTQIARILDIEPYYVRYGTETKVMQPAFLAGQVMKALKTFCNSEDDVPSKRHFAYIDGIDVPTADGGRTYQHNDAIRDQLYPALLRGWDDWENPQGQLRYEHDAYVKVWALSECRMPVQFIVVDEAQDLTGVMMQILRKQQARGVQVVAIGDAAQVIYQWRGTVSVFGEDYADMWAGRTTLTTSFRFGQTLADLANLLLTKANANIRLAGNPDRETTLGHGGHDALLTRTNAAAIKAMFEAIEAGRRFFLIGGGDEIAKFAAGAAELQLTGRTNHPELACFTSWQQVLDYVQNDPAGDELKLMVGMIEDYGAERIHSALSRQAKMADAELVISTVHKSKGLQFDRVALGSDFADPGTREDGEAEWRLLYVAATRAKFHLDHTACLPVLELLEPAEEDAPAVTSEQPSHVLSTASLPSESSAYFRSMQ